MLLQHAVAAGGHPLSGTVAEYVWLLPLLPLLGFVINGLLSLTTSFHRGPSDPSAVGHDHHHAGAAVDGAVEQDHGAHGHGDDHAAHEAPARHRFAGLVSLVGPAVLLAAFGLAAAMFLQMRGIGEMHAPFIQRYFSWMPVGDLQIDAALQLDQLSMLMVLVITGIGSLIHLFSVGYMQDDPGYPRYFAYLNLFVFFMLLLVLGANVPMLFIGWEGVGLCSYLLIGFWFSEKANADAGKKAFIVNRIGDFGLLVAMFLIFANLGTLDFQRINELAPATFAMGGALVTAICLFAFLGCTGKSAQIPLYVWLPDAMAGPTPVSALIHAATMVTAGVYLIARMAVLFSMAPVASLTVALVGALTAIFAATIGLKQWDIKKVLAYSTVSQLGYMFVGVGVGAYTAGVFHLVTHAFFKALLFLGSGSVIFAMHRAYHATHSHEDAQDMRNMGGLARHMPVTNILMWIATLAISGVPFLSGFYSKDEILASAFARAHGSALADARWLGIPGSVVLYVVYALGLAAALLTAIYMTRMMIYTFMGPNRTGDAERPHLAEAPWIMTGPLVVLGALSLFGGLLNLPEVFPFDLGHLVKGEALHHWLEPVVGAATERVSAGSPAHPEGSTEYFLIGAAILIGLAGIAFAFARLKPARLVPKKDAVAEEGFERVLVNKWYVDEAYDAAVVRPTLGLSRSALWRGMDQILIDGTVNLAARTASGIGRLGSRLQTGTVGAYAWVLVLGVLAVLSIFTIGR